MKNTLVLAVLIFTAAVYAKNNKFNPAIGLNAMTLFKNSSDPHLNENDGFSIQGLELQFSADVDAYFRAQAVIGFHEDAHHHEEGETEEEADHGMKVHVEEAFVETLSLDGYTLKLGKFFSNFGKYNNVHTHALPFIYRTKLQEMAFGHEAFTQAGVAVSFLLPTSWFSEINLEVLEGESEELFAESKHGMAYVLKLKNLWDLSETSTFEWGLSALDYKADDKTTKLVGTDFTFKFRPDESLKKAKWTWSTEFIHKNTFAESSSKNGGVNTFVKYQLTDKWHLQTGYEYLGFGKRDGTDLNAYSLLAGYAPTEFSSVRTQLDSIHTENEIEKRVSLQLNISIGAHPAHQY